MTLEKTQQTLPSSSMYDINNGVASEDINRGVTSEDSGSLQGRKIKELFMKKDEFVVAGMITTSLVAGMMASSMALGATILANSALTGLSQGNLGTFSCFFWPTVLLGGAAAISLKISITMLGGDITIGDKKAQDSTQTVISHT